MTILINVQHEPSRCNALCNEVIMEFMLASILLKSDFIQWARVSTDLALF